MTTPDLQSLIDDMARSIAAFNDSEHTWQDCPEDPAHHKGRLCEHQVQALARHMVANKHPVQQGRIEAARLTDEELGQVAFPFDLHDPEASVRKVADAATAKALDFQDARRKALVVALREARKQVDNPTRTRREMLTFLDAALKQEEEANG